MSEKIFGLHAVTAALDAGRECHRLYLQDSRRDKRLQSIMDKAQGASIPVERLDRHALDEMAGDTRHQGVIGEFAAQELPDSIPELLDSISGTPFLLVLDGVQDPHNLGACLRSANAAGVHAVIVPKDNAAGLTPTVRKVAAGAAEVTPLITVTNLARAMRELKEAGIWLVGLAGEAEQDIYDVDMKGSLALVMGAEGEGLRRLTRKECDFLARLPMAGSVESLNVSVATGISLWEALRQRR
ncbi:MAG: 23S rRNA (guanosine(2251)-2'-O)-methyltransferase RlmB [Gammaproteobacteria bacterium]|nr:23S rRNA (guanosine(2251)-2'-O)-methyltransferase RlmB [Gammaproteobacteria bacterium]